jgi:pantoate--beta-alanine ligase
LCAAKDAFDRGERDGDRLRAIMREVIETEPLAKLDYVSAANATTLQELGTPSPQPAAPFRGSPYKGEGVLLSMAVRVGKPRLIDNFLYENGKWLTEEVAYHR